MKSILKISFFLLIILFLGTFCFATPLETSNNLYKILTEKSISVQKQYLNGNLSENFAYNIIIDYGKTKQDTSDEIIISISQEETDGILENMLDFLASLKKESIPVPVKIILSALDISHLPEPYAIKNSGLKTFVSNTDFSKNCIVYVINADNFSAAKKNQYISLITGGAKTVTPFTLLQKVIKACTETNSDYYIEVAYFSLFRLGAVKVPSRLEYFLANEIPAISMNIESSVQAGKTFSVLKHLILNHEDTGNKSLSEWDRQYSILSFFNKTIVFTEKTQVYLFIAIFTLLFFLLFSLNYSKNFFSTLKTDFKQAWFLPLVLLFIDTISLFIAQKICTALIKDYQVFPQFTLLMKLLISLSLFYLVTSTHYFIDFPKQSEIYSLITVFTAIINLLVYSLVDFSFMPLFTIQLFLFFIFRNIKKTNELIISLLICIIPCIPFAVTLISYCNTDAIYKLIDSPFLQNTLYSLLLLPYQFLIIRIIVSRGAFGKHFTTTNEKILKAILFPSGFLLIFIISSIIFSASTSRLNYFSPAKTLLTDSSSKTIKITRTQKSEHNYTEYSCVLDSSEQAIRYDIEITSKDILPLFDSNYPGDILSESKKCIFHLEEYPPPKFILNWKSDSNEKPEISITAFFSTTKNSVRKEKYILNFGEQF